MKKRKLRKNIKVFLIAGGVLVAVILGLLIAISRKSRLQEASDLETSTPVPSASATPEQHEPYEFSKADLAEIRDELRRDRIINGDVKAILAFPSGLVHEPVLQGPDNTKYLYEDWKTGDSLSYGSITMDYENDLDQDDMNTIIYGHYIYEFRNEDRSLVFTPLALLQEEENYEANRYVALVTEKDIRYYEVASVYDCPMVDVENGQVTEEDLQFNLVTYDPDYFQTYLNAVKQHQYYDTGIAIQSSDHLLSLQTCIEEKPESREIVLCREVDRVFFTD